MGVSELFRFDPLLHHTAVGSACKHELARSAPATRFQFQYVGAVRNARKIEMHLRSSNGDVFLPKDLTRFRDERSMDPSGKSWSNNANIIACRIGIDRDGIRLGGGVGHTGRREHLRQWP